MSKIFFSIFLIIFIFLFFNKLYSSDLPNTPFHSDEIVWPCMGYIYNLLQERNFSMSLWNKSIWDFTGPPIPRYIYGWWIDTKIGQNYYKEFNCNDYAHYLNQKLSDLSVEQKLILFSLRNLNLVFALLVLVLTFLLFQNLFGTVIGLVGTFFLGFNPLFRLFATRSITEMMFMTTIILGLILLRIFQNSRKDKPILLSISIGVCTGLSIMTKSYGIMVLPSGL